MRLRIARSRSGGEITHYDVFNVEEKPGMTVLNALFCIQDNTDPSLAFRYSCRGAVCGSCAMLVDKLPVLACRTQLLLVKDNKSQLKPFAAITDRPDDWDQDNEILIEPLPNLTVLKDLVVDMEKFYQDFEKMLLWAEPATGDEPRRQSPEERKRVEKLVNCILCALCYGSCPVNAEMEGYVGPSALAKSWRFYQDSRVENPERYLDAASKPEGAPMCDLIMNCVRVCPKGVAPGGAIRKIKAEIEK